MSFASPRCGIVKHKPSFHEHLHRNGSVIAELFMESTFEGNELLALPIQVYAVLCEHVIKQIHLPFISNSCRARGVPNERIPSAEHEFTHPLMSQGLLRSNDAY